MALINYLRPNYPQQTEDTQGYRRIYVFRGPTDILAGLKPIRGGTLDGFNVEKTTMEPIETTAWSDLTVETYKSVSLATSETNDDQYPFFEIDQVQIEKSLRQHPSFSSMTATDWKAIEYWEEEKTTVKALFQYYVRDKDGLATGSPQTLSATAQSYAKLRMQGVESFLDFAPVVRRTTKYIGSTTPDCSDAGQKTSAPSYAPDGYQWLKTADRISKQGVRASSWIRQEEWTGARTVLLDKDELFLP